MHTSFNFIHYSIDDTIHVFKQLTEKQPNSIFDINMFASTSVPLKRDDY